MNTRGIVPLTTDQATAASTNWDDIPGLSFSVLAAIRYHVRAVLIYTVAATTTGARFGFAANPVTAATLMAMFGYQPDGVGTIDGGGHDDYVTLGATTGGYTAPANSPDTAGSLAIIEGIIVPSVDQVLQLACGPEAAAAVTVKAGSFIQWKRLN